MSTVQEILLFNQIKRNVTDLNYLVNSYRQSGNSLYSHTIFKFIADQIKTSKKPIRILDLGCADGRSRQLLTHYGVHISRYCGIDNNSKFSPSLISDIRDVHTYMSQLDFTPNVVLITDVLEHLENGTEDIFTFLNCLEKYLPEKCQIFISTPQMYRLDRFKLKHLQYSEHKVRFSLDEWKNILDQNLVVSSSYGIGYISILPYLVMAIPWYDENGCLGIFFKTFRDFLSRSFLLRRFEYGLTRILCVISPLQSFSNSVLFVCKPKNPTCYKGSFENV
ncbi:MAG: methyltransferase domain-containing protein [Bdellovibrionaceae bacterium]|nr:methyltransferase domain-containing protein [Pseudobdellovibrionaceae bacterium]